MTTQQRQRGFSLTEVLIAVGTLAVGMLFVGGTFVLGVHYSVLTTEKTYTAAVLQKAETMLQLQAWDRGDAEGDDLKFAWVELKDPNYFAYPYDQLDGSQYTWAALVPPAGELGKAIFFVCRSVDHASYSTGEEDEEPQTWPRPITTSVEFEDDDLITSDDDFLRVGSVLVSDKTGLIYRVIGRGTGDQDEAFRVQPELRDDEEDDQPFWIIPPNKNTGKNPCISVFSRLMRF